MAGPGTHVPLCAFVFLIAAEWPRDSMVPALSEQVLCNVWYKEMRFFLIHKQAITRAGYHQRHTQQTPAHQCRPTTLHEPQTDPQPGGCKHLTNATLSHHTAPCGIEAPDRRHRGAVTTTGTTGSHVVHIQLRPRHRCNPPAPVMKPRHASSGALGHNRQNVRTWGSPDSEPNHAHAHTHTH